MNGVKITIGNIANAKPKDFSVDTDYPLWISDLKRNPKHYGLIKATIGNLPAFSSKTLLSVNHNYKKTPSFITQWYFPVGTSPAAIDNQTYGVGSLEAFVGGGNLLEIKAYSTPTRFYIQAINGNSSDINNQYVEFKYYIMAQPLSERLISV